MSPSSRVAFAGFAGAGKDEAAKFLISRGYKRHNFGDIIKSQLNELILRHFHFSAFTEDRSQKEKIRPILEQWGEVNYHATITEYFATLPWRAVNTRLVRTKEAERWHLCGGVIILITKPAVKAATAWEDERLAELVGGGYVDEIVTNDGTPARLWAKVCKRLGICYENPPGGIL